MIERVFNRVKDVRSANPALAHARPPAPMSSRCCSCCRLAFRMCSLRRRTDAWNRRKTLSRLEQL